MIFTSEIFLFWFLPAVLLGYYLLPFRWRTGFLAAASYVFYGWWRLDFVALMLFSTAIDFRCGLAIQRAHARVDSADHEVDRRHAQRWRKRALIASIAMNLGLLGYFKYWNFGVDTLASLLGDESLTWPDIVLPVGISFYTFQSMSYSIDVYRRTSPALGRFTDFACYIALFPQLVAGPIVRYGTLANQLLERSHTLEKLSRGAFLFQVGLAKKLLLADSFAVVADQAFATHDPTLATAWVGTFAYALQIYFDFSGYSDMAIGLGALFGFTFPVNFNSPYKSLSITDFWRRWHMSLSSWLRDYLYVPLGGNRKGRLRTYINLMATMLLGGLWHGAAMTFLLWGAYQGAWLAIERMTSKRALYGGLPRPMQVAITFVIVMGGWVLFRAEDAAQAGAFFAAAVGFAGNGATALTGIAVEQWVLMGGASVLVWFAPNSQEIWDREWALPRLLIPAVSVVASSQVFIATYSPFLYFQF